MKQIPSLLTTLSVLLCLASPGSALEHLRISTTTSIQDSGLLKVLLPPFEKRHNCRVDVIAVGTGQALKLGERGDVDLVLVHARRLEDKFVADGFGVNRRDVMYNDFVIIGPRSDPAGVARARTAAEALKLIAAKKATFVSRGDNSGTHTRELELWKATGISPRGSWYIEAGQGMGPVITMATERRGYTLADHGTYDAFRGKKTDLVILFQGERELLNPYGIIAVNPKRFPHVKHDLAMRLIDYITGNEGRKIIASYRPHGVPVFFIYKQ